MLLRALAGIALLLLLVLTVQLARIHRNHLSVHGHTAPFGLHADAIINYASIGIPGITKMYEGKLTNYGILPIPVTLCKFVDDTLSHGTMIAYSIERWNRGSGHWESVVNMNNSDFCRPYPLGIVEARLVATWLWPGQSVTTGEEATAARDSLKGGDSARFVLYLKTGNANSPSIPTSEFPIDETPLTDIPLRLRH